MSKLKWTSISPLLSDATKTFKVDGCDGMTIREFITTVIEESNDRFLEFRIKRKGEFLGTLIDLKDAKKLTPKQQILLDMFQNTVVESVTCNGGWGNMGYTIIIKNKEL